MEARDQLLRLLRIQELALEISQAKQVVESAPERIERIENHFRERNAEYVAVKERHDALDSDQRSRNSELGELEEKRKKYMEDLMQVKNQREYAAMLKEIDSVKAQITDHEEAILKDLEEIEKLKTELATHEEHIAKEREAVERDRGAVESETEKARQVIETRSAERTEVESELPRKIMSMLRRLEAGRQGIFLTRAEKGTCQSCYVRVRPQVFQEIRQATAVHTCDSCRRFLYFEPSLKPQPQPDAQGSEDGVGAVDGGAV